MGRTVYEAHCYFDSNGSGKYANSFSKEYDRDPRMMNRGGEWWGNYPLSIQPTRDFSKDSPLLEILQG